MSNDPSPSPFQELCDLFSKAADASSEYRTQAIHFSLQFTEGFRAHIGAPENYLDADRQTKKRYVEPVKIIFNADGQEEFVPEENFYSLLSYNDEDEFCLFGIRLVLDRGINTFPKAAFAYRVRFRLAKEECELKVADKVFQFNLADQKGRISAYDYMVDLYRKAFTRKPWERVEKQAIGFIRLSEEQ